MRLERSAYRLGLMSQGLRQQGLDGLLFYSREVHDEHNLIYQLTGGGLSGSHAIIVTPSRKPVAIVNVHDAGNVPTDLFDVVEYQFEDDPAKVVAEYLQRLGVRKLGLAVSRDTAVLDVMSYGMFSKLRDAFNGTDVEFHTDAGENVLYSAYARRTADEIEGLRRAVEATDAIFDAAELEALKVGATESQVYHFFLEQMGKRDVKPSWSPDRCPIVAVGNNSARGHHAPGNDAIQKGSTLFIDFGTVDPETGMPADLQRCYFVIDPDKERETERVVAMFRTQLNAREAAVAKMVVGSTGIEVDKAGRDVVTAAGYPPFNHAFGHTLSAEGVHGVGPVAGPDLPKYGELPFRKLEADMVLTAEPSVIDPEGRQGRISSEDDVLITNRGPQVLNRMQRELFFIR